MVMLKDLRSVFMCCCLPVFIKDSLNYFWINWSVNTNMENKCIMKVIYFKQSSITMYMIGTATQHSKTVEQIIYICILHRK